MSVVISNVSDHGDLLGPNTYIVHFAGRPVIARFEHIRADGLAACLRRAAKAVDGEQSVATVAIAPSPESTDLQEHHGNVHEPVHSGDGLRPDRPVLPVGSEERPAERPVAESDDYVVWSNEHAAWWGADRRGYYTHLSSAGRYSREDALKICIGARGGRAFNVNPSEVPIRLEDAEAFWTEDGLNDRLKREAEERHREFEREESEAFYG